MQLRKVNNKPYNIYANGKLLCQVQKKILSPMRYDNLRTLYSKLSCPTNEPQRLYSKLDHLEVYK